MGDKRKMTEQELYNEYRKSDCKSFTDFLINKITNLKTDYEVLSCSVGDFGELQEKLEEEQRKNNGLSDNLNKAKKIMNIAVEGIKYWGIVGGTERPFEKQAEKLFNLFLDKADQFIKDSEVEK